MAKKINAHSILFLYEGDTEGEFYNKFFDINIPSRSIRISRANLHGVYSLDMKVENKINSYLDSVKFKDCNKIHIYVAYDREGERAKSPGLNIDNLRKKFVRTKSRIKSINHIVATQDLESWFFHDMEGVYKYLRVPVAERRIKIHPNVDSTNNKILSALFHKYNKHYQKGKRAEGFIDSLNIDTIRDNVSELKDFVTSVKTLL